MNVNPFSYLIEKLNKVIQTNDNVVNLSSKTAKQLIDDVYAGGAKVWYISAAGGQKLSDLPIVQAGTYVVYAFTYYKAIHFIGTDGRSFYFNYGDNTWKQIALTSDVFAEFKGIMGVDNPSKDFNDYTTTGWWNNAGTNQAGTANAPHSSDNGYMFVIGYADTVYQFWFSCYRGDGISFRKRYRGTWSTWSVVIS